MKTASLLSLLCLLSLMTFAQADEPISKKPVQGNKIIGFDIVGLSAMALNSPVDPLTNAQMFDFRYFFKDDIAFRLGLGINNRTTTTTTKSDPKTYPVSETENKNKTSGFTIGLGAEKHIKTKSRSLDPYVGAGIYISSLGDNTVTDKSKLTLANGDYQNIVTETVNPGGSGFGFAVNTGFLWFFAQSLALGGEFSLGYGSGSTGGDGTETETTTESVGGVVTTTVETTATTNKVEYSGMGTLNTGTIRFLVKF